MVDLIQREAAGPKAPGPVRLPAVLVPGLVHAQNGLAGQGVGQLPVRPGQRGRGLGDHLGQLPRADGHPQHVAQEGPDGRVGHVAGALLVGHQGRQPRSQQPRSRHLRRQGSGDDLTRPRRAIPAGAMLDDHEWPIHQSTCWTTRQSFSGASPSCRATRARRSDRPARAGRPGDLVFQLTDALRQLANHQRLQPRDDDILFIHPPLCTNSARLAPSDYSDFQKENL